MRKELTNLTEPGWNMHTSAEIGIDDFQANRSPDEEERLFAAFGEYGEHVAAICRIVSNTGIRPPKEVDYEGARQSFGRTALL